MAMIQGAPIFTTTDWTQGFDDIIDCRSPAEFAYDHVPGAVNLYVLDDRQRAQVGAVYKQQGAFAGRRLGAGLVSRNIGKHLAENLSQKPKDWRALLYCWRGGQRSTAFATVLGHIGYRVTLLEGGYKAYRAEVLGRLPALCEQPRYVVLTGRTGVGKTKLLQTLAAQGESVLDLEGLAKHRGSLFGGLGQARQPSSPMFDSLLFDQLNKEWNGRIIWVEAESAKVGQLHLPRPLVDRIRQSPRILLQASLSDRITRILSDYESALANVSLAPLITMLPGRISNTLKAKMHQLAEQKQWDELAQCLIECHYDPSYQRSSNENFVGPDLGHVIVKDQDFSSAAKICRQRVSDMLSFDESPQDRAMVETIRK